MKNRKGFIRISRENLNKPEVMAILGGVFTKEFVAPDFNFDVVKVYGTSPHFDMIADYEEIPEYIARVDVIGGDICLERI